MNAQDRCTFMWKLIRFTETLERRVRRAVADASGEVPFTVTVPIHSPIFTFGEVANPGTFGYKFIGDHLDNVIRHAIGDFFDEAKLRWGWSDDSTLRVDVTDFHGVFEG